MNHLSPLALVTAFSLTTAFTAVAASPLLIDDFNSYASGSYVQTQGGLNWSRFGTATADGIYSVAGGSDGGRSASYLTSFASGENKVNGSVRYTFASSTNFSDYVGFSLDLRTNVSLAGTQVYAQVSTDGGTPTIFETLVGQSVSDTGFVTFRFSFTPDNLRLIQGSQSIETVMANLKSVTFRFNNSTSTGAQTFTFDQLTAIPAPIPEPSSLVLLAGAGLGAIGFRRWRSRSLAGNH